MLEIHKDFLRAYAHSVDISEEDPEKIIETLCDNNYYTGESDKQFSSMLYGYLWGKTNDFVYANIASGVLLHRMNLVYYKDKP